VAEAVVAVDEEQANVHGDAQDWNEAFQRLHDFESLCVKVDLVWWGIIKWAIHLGGMAEWLIWVNLRTGLSIVTETCLWIFVDLENMLQ
jgi:hypothetical protein